MGAIVYLLQVSACMGIFYSFYYFMLNRLTFFTINRWYLMATLLLSFVIPLLTIPVQQQAIYPTVIQQAVYVNELQNLPVSAQPLNAPQAVIEPAINWMNVLKTLYEVAVVVLFIRLIVLVVTFFAGLKHKQSTRVGRVHILRGNKNVNNGSFLNYIFLNDEELSQEELQQIIAHEMLHVTLYHSVDRIAVKIAQIILWFNPFVYLYARAIEENHEFEVDREIGESNDKNKYAELLLHLSVAGQGTLYHNFSMVPLKKRIIMLFTKPSSQVKKIVYVLVIPVVLVSCLAFARLKTDKPGKKAEINKTEVYPDTVKYRQKVKANPEREKQLKEFKAYKQTKEYKAKSAFLDKIIGKTITVKVEGAVTDKVYKDEILGFNLNYNGEKLFLQTIFSDEKGLKSLQPGDVISFPVFGGSALKNSRILVTADYVIKDNRKILHAKATPKINDYPFLFEANKVRFAEGKINNVEKYANGKWKIALFETETGYRFKVNFKPNAPDMKTVENKKPIRLRFVHEVKTGDKTYDINDWVSITANVRDYGIKNPELFHKFYVSVTAKTAPQTTKYSAIYGAEKFGEKPLVLIDGTEYPSEILYKISASCIKSVSGPPFGYNNNATNTKGKNRVVYVTTKNGTITYMSKQEQENLYVERSVPASQFYTRLRLKNDKGEPFDRVILRRGGGMGQDNMPVNGKVGFIVNNTLYNENDFKKLFPADKAEFGTGLSVGHASAFRNSGVDVSGYDVIFKIGTANTAGLSRSFKVDTIEYNTRNAQLRKTAGAEDLLSTLPGITVKVDGAVFSNEQKVNKIRINGKDYTGNINSIPADIIDRVGIYDLPPNKILNIELKGNK